MKLYRVTVRRRSDGSIYKREVFTKASSVRSFKGYWGSRWTSGAMDRPGGHTYTIEVETAFVNNWAAIDENLEKVEKAIAAMPDMSETEISALIERLAANLAAKIA